MVEEKRERVQEASESQQNSPRLDLVDAAEVGAGWSSPSPTGSSEWPSSGEAEAGSSSSCDSTGDSGRCEHHVVVDRALLGDLTHEKLPRACQYPKCQGNEDDQGMMKCTHCTRFFCSGAGPVDRGNPQGHARCHADEEQHWVAGWCDAPTLGYCFLCARVMRLVDWSYADLAVVARNQKDQRGPGDSIAKDGWGKRFSNVFKKMVAAGKKDKRRIVPIFADDAWEDDAFDQKDQRGPGYSFAKDGWGMPASFAKDERETGASWDEWDTLPSFADVFQGMVATGKKDKRRIVPSFADDAWEDDAFDQKDQPGPWYSVAKDGWGMPASTAKDEWDTLPSFADVFQRMVATGMKDKRRMVPSFAKDPWEDDAYGPALGHAYGDDYVIRGIPNLGLTCYMNATLQCLLALGKLRTMIQSPDAHLGSIGLHLQQLFVETGSWNDAIDNLNPRILLTEMQVLHPKLFRIWRMEDSHEFLTSLFNSLDNEVERQNESRVMQGGQVFPAFGISLFRGELLQTKSCQKGLHNDPPKTVEFGELFLSFPSKDPPARSVASPPMNKSHGSPLKISKSLFQQTDKADEDKIQTIAEGTTSQIPGSGLGDGAMEKTLRPLQVDSSEVKDVVHGHMQTRKNDVPQETIEVPIKASDFIPDLFDATEGMGESTLGSRITEDTVTTEAKEKIYSVKVSIEDKEEAQSSDIVHDEAQHMNSLWSIEDCLELFCREVMERCEKCCKVAEPIMASTNINTTVDGDETELSDRKTCPSERSSDFNNFSDVHHQVVLSENISTEEITSEMSCGEKVSASCSTTNEKAEIHQGVQQAELSCLPTDKQTDLLSAQDSQDTSTKNQGSAKQEMLDDHSAQQMEETQNEQKDGNGCVIQRHSFTKLPPILTIKFKRYNSDLSKIGGHVSFKEILHLGPYMDPSSEDKDNSSYRLVGVIEHSDLHMNSGHYVAYVRGARHKHQSSGSSSWICTSDDNIREVPLEVVLGREVYILFYERMEE